MPGKPKDPESLIICNGYKDHRFIKTALIGMKLGKKVILVVEKVEEIKPSPVESNKKGKI